MTKVAFTQAFPFIKMMRWSESHYYRPRVYNSRVTFSCIPQFGVQIVCTRKIRVDSGQFVSLVLFWYVRSIACWLFAFYSLWFAFPLAFCLLSDYISAFQWNCKFSHTNYFPSTVPCWLKNLLPPHTFSGMKNNSILFAVCANKLFEVFFCFCWLVWVVVFLLFFAAVATCRLQKSHLNGIFWLFIIYFGTLWALLVFESRLYGSLMLILKHQPLRIVLIPLAIDGCLLSLDNDYLLLFFSLSFSFISCSFYYWTILNMENCFCTRF